MLRNMHDWQSLTYLFGLPLLVLFEWSLDAINIPLYCVTLILAVGISCINHNHAHVSLWINQWLNRFTDYWIGTLQGHPVYLFEVAHVGSHHRYNQLDQDVTRVEQFGSHNHIVGYLLFPLHALRPLNHLKRKYFQQLRTENPRKLLGIISQHVPLIALWIIAVIIDWKKAALFVFIPQLLALHFLLASNYLQHARTQAGSRYNHSRNFVGFMNRILFNVGYHTAHHEWESLHWSELPQAHARLNEKIDPSLNEKSLFGYFIYVLIGRALGIFRKEPS